MAAPSGTAEGAEAAVPGQLYIHRIDAEDRLTFVNDEWRRFAEENGAPDLPERAQGTPLWMHIRGRDLQHVYRAIVARVRASREPLAYPFRCDSPEVRRFMELTVAPGPGGEVEFRSRLLRVEPRQPAAPAVPAPPRAPRVLVVCSWCRRVRTDAWVDIEDAARSLRLFDDDNFPRVSHGVCERCRDRLVPPGTGGRREP
jgi:hypothetical protein